MGDRYLKGLSSDLFVQASEDRDVLAMDLLSFCTECGAVVYRRDLHDAFHAAVKGEAAAGTGARRIYRHPDKSSSALI